MFNQISTSFFFKWKQLDMLHHGLWLKKILHTWAYLKTENQTKSEASYIVEQKISTKTHIWNVGGNCNSGINHTCWKQTQLYKTSCNFSVIPKVDHVIRISPRISSASWKGKICQLSSNIHQLPTTNIKGRKRIPL